MCMVKGGKNESNTFGEGWGMFPPTPPKRRIWGGRGGAAGGDALEEVWSGRSGGKKGRVGEKRPARTQDIGLVAPARMARQCMWRDRVATPGQVARSNVLLSANKNQYGLKLKYY